MPVWSLSLQGSSSLGLLEIPQVGFLVIIPIYQDKRKRQVHLVNWLQSTWIRQKANGIRWGCAFGSTVLLSRDQPCPSSSSPASGAFSQLLSGTRKDRACQNQGSVLSMIMTAVETVNITQNQRERGGLLWDNVGRGDWPCTSFYSPRRLQEPPRFHLRGPTSRDLVS